MSLQNWSALVGIAVGGVSLLTIAGKWIIVRPMKAYIKDMTYPIQPNANGGKSLADVAVTVATINQKVDNVESWLTKVDDRLIHHIEQHNS